MEICVEFSEAEPRIWMKPHRHLIQQEAVLQFPPRLQIRQTLKEVLSVRRML